MKIAFVTDSANPNINSSDDRTAMLLKAKGHSVVPHIWDSQNAQSFDYDHLVFRSCWNYHKKIDEFIKWLGYLNQQKIHIQNPLQTIRWNLNKKYLLDLKNLGVNVVPTHIINAQSDYHALVNQLLSAHAHAVAKPEYGASGHGVMSTLNTTHGQFINNIKKLLGQGKVLIQPLIHHVTTNGEISLIYFNQSFSHAVKKTPAKNDYRVNHEHGGKESVFKAENTLINWGKQVLEKIPHKVLYARVDVVVTLSGPLLMELELIEPYLYLEFNGNSPQAFANAIEALWTNHK